MEIYDKIRSLREAKKWSQEEMAKKLYMSVSGYSKIERGETEISISKLKKIASILETDLLELMLLAEKHVAFLIGDSNNGCNIIGSAAELNHEIQKLQLIIELKDKELAMQQREIAYLKELLEMHKNSKNNLAE